MSQVLYGDGYFDGRFAAATSGRVLPLPLAIAAGVVGLVVFVGLQSPYADRIELLFSQLMLGLSGAMPAFTRRSR